MFMIIINLESRFRQAKLLVDKQIGYMRSDFSYIVRNFKNSKKLRL